MSTQPRAAREPVCAVPAMLPGWLATSPGLEVRRSGALASKVPAAPCRQRLQFAVNVSASLTRKEIAGPRTSWNRSIPARFSGAIVNGTRAITADTALRLGRHLGTSPEIWLDRRSNHELRFARRARWSTIEAQVRTRVA